ncbi:restriction endonuclease subunit S [Nocardiopsis sp. FR6]|uniref:restriction endonuclease subunit S n=1 Tax=Nocardiopsis sp. FR6 TaxID=2605986 RepID=UPI00135830FF|nr:restriction endonuclease subunit S [Nocardiopsis sp. FR6]
MTSYYQDTVNSGYAWLGWVPRHWDISPLGQHFIERSETVSDKDFAPLSVTKDGVVPQLDNVAKTSNNDGRKLVRAGDFVINSRSDRKGSSGVSSRDGSVSVVYSVLEPRPTLYGRFAHHLLRSPAFQEEYYRWGSGIVADLWSTRYSAMKRILLAIPPLGEQREIAHYLDSEIAQIDTLIAEQQRLIEMLRERRQAMIDHVFTRCSEDRVPLRRFISFLTSGSRGWGGYYADFGDVFVRIGNLSRGSLFLGGEVQRVNLPPVIHEGQRTKLQVDDLLFSITAYIGSVAVVDQEWADSYVSQHVALCRIDTSVLDPKFTGYFMLATEGRGQLSEGAIGGTKVQLALDDIRALRVPVPTLEEQRQIVDYLDRETSRIDMLIAESERLIELSQERRSALITAAVTGQIDVRQEA